MAKDFIEFLSDDFPELKDIPMRDAQIILLSAAGIEKSTIAQGMDISRQTVYDVLGKYKIQELIRGGINLQMMLTRTQVGTILVEASTELMKKKGDLKNMNATQLLNVMSMCTKIVQGMKIEKAGSQPPESKSSDPMEDLKNAITAEAT